MTEGRPAAHGAAAVWQVLIGAPLRAQQVWLLKRFGTECNLGNIAPSDVLSLETLRLGLRSDTVERFALDGGD